MKSLIIILLIMDASDKPILLSRWICNQFKKKRRSKRIHSLMGFTGDMCPFKHSGESYAHPLLHLENRHIVTARSTPFIMNREV
jgi:hypothetical protein